MRRFDSQLKELAQMVMAAERLVVLTGAGVSTPSGIPDFRSDEGLYTNPENREAFELMTFMGKPAVFYKFAKKFYMQVSNAQPNSVHMALASWEKRGLSVEVVTQNIDDLHERAGTTCVYHVHGAISTSTCQQCDKQVQTKTLMQAVQSGHIPYCECGGVFKPDVTFFGESLPDEPFNKAMKAFTKADVVLILGTSLGVYPAAALPEFRRRIAKLAILNIRPTPLDREADLVIHDDLASVFATLLEKM